MVRGDPVNRCQPLQLATAAIRRVDDAAFLEAAWTETPNRLLGTLYDS